MKRKLTLFLISGCLICNISINSSTLFAFDNVQITNAPYDEKNPSIAIKDSLIYVAWGVPEKENVYFVRSTNSGRTWELPLLIGSKYKPKYKDKPVVVVDNNGYIYIVWQNNMEILIRKSTDLGISFSDSIRIGSGHNPDLAVDNYGNIYVVWESETPRHTCYFSKSIDGGINFINPIVVDSTCIAYNSYPPKLAISSSGNNVYVVWAAAQKPHEYVQVWFSNSLDGGETFNPKINTTTQLFFSL